jgi:low affinity Fe/Cu permease
MSELSSTGHPRGSRAVHRVQAWSARTPATGIAALVSTAAILAAVFSPFQDAILIWFEAAAAGVTLVMVFALQHTQTRQQVVLQHKLDELLRALPGTDERLIRLEAAPQQEFDEIVVTEGPDSG